MAKAGKSSTKKWSRMTVGERHGRLVAMKRVGLAGSIPLWQFQCDCGSLVIVRNSDVRHGNTRSCGCLNSEIRIAQGHRNATHGKTNTPEYSIWIGMIRRCCDPRRKEYSSYGGRGITVCKRWRDSFSNFYSDIGPRPSLDHSLHRVNNDLGYEPSNVVWATAKEQNRNHGGNKRVTYKGREMPLIEACELSGVPYTAAWQRIKSGWLSRDVFTVPVGSRNRWSKRT